MRAKRTLEDGLTILQSIADSDAFKEMRERLRDGATRLADNDRVPRLIAGSAGILAALLADPGAQAEHEYHDDGSRDSEASDLRGHEGYDADDEAWAQSAATVRDLDDPALLDAEPPGDEAVHSEEPADDGDRLLRFDVDEREVGEAASAAASPATKKTSRGRAKAKATAAARPTPDKKPAKKSAGKKKASARKDKPTDKPDASRAASKPAKRKAPKPKAPAVRKTPRPAAKLPPKAPRSRAKKSS